MAWLILFIAGILEIIWAVGLKHADGLTRPRASLITIAAMIASMGLLAYAVRDIPIGTAYAIWTGIGAAGTAIAGMILFGEPTGALRVHFLCLIVAGIVGLRWTLPTP